MTFVVAAAAEPATVWRDQDSQVLAEAENVIVGILFDDIVRTLLRPATVLVPLPVAAERPRRERMAPAPTTVGRQHTSDAWARSPPGQEHNQELHPSGVRTGGNFSRQ
jgi:hypothetical protein